MITLLCEFVILVVITFVLSLENHMTLVTTA